MHEVAAAKVDHADAAMRLGVVQLEVFIQRQSLKRTVLTTLRQAKASAH
jgi:hypothetical protein